MATFVCETNGCKCTFRKRIRFGERNIFLESGICFWRVVYVLESGIRFCGVVYVLESVIHF